MVNSVKSIFGLWVLSIILNNTHSLCHYLQGRRSMSSAVVEMPTWPYRPYASVVVKKVSIAYGKWWLTSSQFELREAWALWETPTRSLQDFVGGHVQRQTQLTSESHHRMNTYYASIEMVLTEMKKASFVLLNFTKSTSKFWKPVEHVREFATCAQIRPHWWLFQRC